MKDFFTNLLQEALAAARKAHKECMPTPVHFYPADLFDKPLGPGNVELEGDCGGAYITGLGGNSEIVRFFKKYAKDNKPYSPNYILPNGISITKGVYTGYTLSIPPYPDYRGQSHEKYKAGAEAFAEVLRAGGVKCGVHDYLT